MKRRPMQTALHQGTSLIPHDTNFQEVLHLMHSLTPHTVVLSNQKIPSLFYKTHRSHSSYYELHK